MFFRLWPMVHLDIAKTPIFLKIRLLDHWALSRISTKIKKIRPVQLKSQASYWHDFTVLVKFIL